MTQRIKMKNRYLTKSKFALALECPTKLYYDGKKEYVNQNIEDSFLLALAEGGFQVGELAKQYHPEGYQIETKDYEEALKETEELLKKENVVIFEAAVRSENLFIRIDILVKNGTHLELIEVKAKSFDEDVGDFFTTKGLIKSEWKSYLYDVAFQKHVLSSAYPSYTVSAYLMMADKKALCPTDGLNQKFRIIKDEKGRKRVSVSDNLTEDDLSVPLLVKINVDDSCTVIYATGIGNAENPSSFAEDVKYLSDCYERDEKISSYPSKECASCEFKVKGNNDSEALKSGFDECWQEMLGYTDEDLLDATVLEIWDFRKKNEYINKGLIKLKDFYEDDIEIKKDGKPGISRSQRQWLQIQKVIDNDRSHWIDAHNLSREMKSWVFPLHFIDFETSTVAIPFNKGRRPYEGIAFQFSHHMVHEDGRVEHVGEYLNTEPGVFPNYDFVRKLKEQLEKDEGSIFRYAAHENSYLNMIYQQLNDDTDEIEDRDELCGFIRSITKSGDKSEEQWLGERNMIDLLELVKRFYYDPGMKGSNSIKQVLPAILNSSDFLKKKYSQPLYGAEEGIPSLNFKDWTWIKFDENGKVIDPYKILPKMFLDGIDEENELLSNDDVIKDGGAALTAYAKMQFEDMSEYERSELASSLLKYCELDTLAMVMIYEGWKDFL